MMRAAERQSHLTSRDLEADVDDEQLQDADNAIYDVTEACSDILERLILAIDVGALPEKLSLTSDASAYSEDEPTTHIRSLRNNFAFWIDYTGALAPIEASLDARLHGHDEIKQMVVELLEMVERNLRSCKHPTFPTQFSAVS